MTTTIYPFNALISVSIEVATSVIPGLHPGISELSPTSTLQTYVGGLIGGDKVMLDALRELLGPNERLEPGMPIEIDQWLIRQLLEHWGEGDRHPGPCNGICHIAAAGLRQSLSAVLMYDGIPHTVQLIPLTLPKE